MRTFVTFLFAGALAMTASGCGGDAGSSNQPAASGANAAVAQTPKTRGGIITIGDQSWTFVPSIQCRVFPNGQVSIAGHAAEDPSLQISIDYLPDRDRPRGVALETDESLSGWFTVTESLEWQIEERRVRGTAIFSERRGGQGTRAEGSFDINC